MEHWNSETCKAMGELGFGSALMLTGLALGAGLITAFSLGIF